MDTPIPYDEQKYPDIVRAEKEQESKKYDSHEVDLNWKTCEYAKPLKDENGHFDEIMCCYINNEFNLCGVLCPRTKGE